MAHVWNVLDGNIYVSKNGNDTTGNGSMAAPYASINKATTMGVAGNKIVIGTGVWQESRGVAARIYSYFGDGMVVFDGSSFANYFTTNSPELFNNIKFQNYVSVSPLGNLSSFSIGYHPKFTKCVFKLVGLYTTYPWGGTYNPVEYVDCLLDSVFSNYAGMNANYAILGHNITITGKMNGQGPFGMSFVNTYNVILYNITGAIFVGDNTPNIGTQNVHYNSSVVLNASKNVNPAFNNPEIGDYTLKADSPCLFAGKNNSNIGAFGLGYSFNANSSEFTKEGGAVFSASSGTDDIVRASQTLNGIAIYLFNLNVGKLSGTVESAWIDLQTIRYLLTTRLFANIIYNASGVATSRADNSETVGEKAVYYDFEFKYCLTEAEKAAATWKSVIWNKAVTIDNSNRGNADAAFVPSEAKYISARFIKIKLYMKE